MMLRTVARLTPCFMPLFGRKNEADYDFIHSEKREQAEKGFERVKRMYTLNEFSEVSNELHLVSQATFCGTFLGACFGGFVKSRDAYVYFIENNQATIFKSTMEAKKRLQDYVTVAFAKGAVKWGWRLGIFTGLFSIIATTMSAYQGDTSLVQYVVAGTITGALFKVNLGMAATFVGAGLGAILSTLGGLTIIGLLKVTGAQMDDIMRALNIFKEAREQQYREALEKSSDSKNDALTEHHKVILEDKGEKKIEEL